MTHTEVLQTISPIKIQSVEILNDLPEDLRPKILEFLPLQDAVRTSILSRHWRNEWSKISSIVVDELFSLNLVVKRHDIDVSAVFQSIVSDVLHRHVGPLRKFVLRIPLYLADRSIIGEWLQLVMQKGVSELTLIDLPHHKNLSSILFSYAGLTHLTLRMCKFPALPSTFTAFPDLISLELERCNFSSNHIERLISSCPELKFLRVDALNISGDSNCLTIQAPKLEHLIVAGFYHMLCLGNNTTNIRKLELNFTSTNQSTIVYRSLPVIQSLRLGPSFMKNKNHENVCEQQMGADLGSLDIQMLYLDGVPPDCPYIHYSVLELLNTYRHLQKLCYVVSEEWNFCNCGITPKLSFWDLSDAEDGNFLSLKYVELSYVTGLGLELEFIKVILERAPVLEVVTIKLSENIEEPDARLRIESNVTQFYRASRIAQIIFKNSEFQHEASVAASIMQHLFDD